VYQVTDYLEAIQQVSFEKAIPYKSPNDAPAHRQADIEKGDTDIKQCFQRFIQPAAVGIFVEPFLPLFGPA
jgi:hypothetical protein